FEAEVAPLLDGRRPMPVPREMLGRMMASAAATLMPVCWEEPFGLVAAEAQTCGCPVVAYRRGALPEVVNGGGFLVEPGDEAGFLAAIDRTDRLDRAEIRDRALARFGLDRMLTAYERELERVAFAGQPRSPATRLPGYPAGMSATLNTSGP
ncbi:MAG TPA: glycosyltransferase, partial [Candidatus Limnocylindrales bacterium]|nr:glycosyltransferase [Candidatus Limnocylindrales bacterium]